MESTLSSTGRRKRAIARVMIKPGKGERLINGVPMKSYLKSDTLVIDAEQPFTLLKAGESFDVMAHVRGGGLSGQCGALRLGISRALSKLSEENRKILRKNGLLTRDSRIIERKKYGRAGARKRFQFSKR